MKYFIDTEFLEGSQSKRFFGLKYGKTPPTIDLISIGIVSLDGRELYLISKDFNLREAWNRFQLKSMTNIGGIGDTPTRKKEYWIRENVLKPIYNHLKKLCKNDQEFIRTHFHTYNSGFCYNSLKALIKYYGLTNSEIAEQIKDFVGPDFTHGRNYTKPKFYAYYADYDWVVFCWLFGKMMELPSDFPMYCIDLKQVSDEIFDKRKALYDKEKEPGFGGGFIDKMSEHPEYPKQQNQHDALDDARWNLELYNFLEKVKL